MTELRPLARAELHAAIAAIDRSEHVDVEYEVRDGRLVERPVSMSDIPTWYPTGIGEHSVAAITAFCASVVDEHAGIAIGAVDDDGTVAGIVIVSPTFERPLAWLAFLDVSRPHRRQGVAGALWRAATERARAEGATQLYVSATPTGSAVGFYLAQGCRLADPVHPKLFADEPDDVHLVCAL